ncbi:MAG TPA: hypothetical protein VH208_11830 [Myxococcaceae bacterium]|nr:hypothetical protein [Myxococcaceae bacterium]
MTRDGKGILSRWATVVTIVGAVIGGTWRVSNEFSLYTQQIRLVEIHLCRIEAHQHIDTFEGCEQEILPPALSSRSALGFLQTLAGDAP